MSTPKRPGLDSYTEAERESLVAEPCPSDYWECGADHTTRRYSFLFPFLVPCVFPDSEMDIVTECFKATGKPTEYLYRTFDTTVFDLGTRGAELNLPSNALMYVPNEDIEELLNFARSMVLFGGSQTQPATAVRVQELVLGDPSCIAYQTLKVYAFVLESANAALYFSPKKGKLVGGACYEFELVKDRSLGDVRSASIVNLLKSSHHDPMGSTESKYGNFEIPENGNHDADLH